MKFLIKPFLILFFVFIPSSVFAQQTNLCNQQGVTIALINGVLTNKNEARKNTDALANIYKIANPQITDINFITLHNPSHLGGAGDFIKTFEQRWYEKYFSYADDYDLHDLMSQLEQELHTQKLIIVGHSQGTLYANALYNLLNHDDSAMKVVGPIDASIGVYGIAVAATHIEKGNHYVTSDTDSVIKSSRNFLPSAPLPANIHIDESLFTGKNEKPEDGGRGHGLIPIYLEFAPERIISDIAAIADTLQSSPTRSNTACVSIQYHPVADYILGPTYAVSDTIVATTYTVSSAIVSTTVNTAGYIVSTGSTVVKTLGTTIGNGAYTLYASTIDGLGSILSPLFTKSGGVITQASLPTTAGAVTIALDTPKEQSPVTVTKVTPQDVQPNIDNNAVVFIPKKQNLEITNAVIATQSSPAIQTTQTTKNQSSADILAIGALLFVGAGGGGGSVPAPVVVQSTTTEPLPSNPLDSFTISSEFVSANSNSKTYRIFGSKSETDSITVGTDTQNASTTFEFLHTLTQGLHNIDWNTGSDATGTFTFDVKTLDAEFSSLTAVASGTTALLSYSQPTDISYYEIFVDNISIATTTDQTFSIDAQSYGTHVYAVIAHDIFGNQKQLDASIIFVTPLHYRYYCSPDQNESYSEGGHYSKYGHILAYDDTCFSYIDQQQGMDMYTFVFRNVEGNAALGHYQDFAGNDHVSNSATAFYNLSPDTPMFAVGIAVPLGTPDAVNTIINYFTAGTGSLPEGSRYEIIHFYYTQIW